MSVLRPDSEDDGPPIAVPDALDSSTPATISPMRVFVVSLPVSPLINTFAVKLATL